MIDNDRMNQLVKSFFEDHDHGREAMQNAEVTENICFISYLENNCIPKAKENENELDMQYFTEYDIHFRMLTLEKIMKLEKFWIVISKATGHFYTMNRDIIVLIDNSEADFLISSLAENNFEVEIREINNSEFIAMVEDLPRIGVRGVQFSDGRIRPMIIPRDTILKADKAKTTINPKLYMESLIFLQEAHKFGKEGKNIGVNEDSPIVEAMREATYLVPAIVQNKEDNQMQIKYPFLNTNVEGQKILPVMTDHKEFENFISNPVMKAYNDLPKEQKVCIELPFVEIYRVFTTDDLFAFSINPMGFNLICNEGLVMQAAKNVKLTNNPNIKVERNGEEIVFPEEGEAEEQKNKPEDTDVLRKKVLLHFIETQEGIIEKNKDIDTDEARKKVEKAEKKLLDFKKQLEALDE